MDFKNTKDLKFKIESLNSRMQVIEEMHKETMEKIIELQNNCCHELIFVNKKYENKAYEYLYCGKCLICGKGITLTPNNINIDNHELVDADNIIDVTESVEEWNLDCDCTLSKNETEEAQRVFDTLFESDYSLRFKECAKHEIIHAIKNMRLTKKK